MDKLLRMSAENELIVYKGKNPYIARLSDKIKTGEVSEEELSYVVNHGENHPININRIIDITPEFGGKLKDTHGVSFSPAKIMVDYVLAETQTDVHVWGKLKRNQIDNQEYWVPKKDIIGDIYFNESNTKVDFELIEEKTDGIELYEHQKPGVKFLIDRNGAILADDMGLGKAECVDNQIFTPNGRQKIGTINVGDYVIGSDGKATLVEGVFPQGVKDLYRVTFNDGYSLLCCKEHLWTVSSNNGGKNNKNRPIRYTTLSVEQMLDKELVLEQPGTGWNKKRPYKFKTYYKQSNGQNKWQIPIVKPIQFKNDDILPIEPYLLGVSLGDGHILKNEVNISLHKDDFDEVFNGINIHEVKPKDNIRKGTIKLNELKTLKLDNTRSHTKFIPDVYKYASIDDRVAILQGLMDTDGYCAIPTGGNFISTEYCSVSKVLADDVAEIVHSLGGIVRMSSKNGSYKKEDGTKVICKRAYRLNIKFSNGINPFRLKRKADLFNQPNKYKTGRYIKDISLETSSEAVCIKVAAEDSLYVSEHGIVTHNSMTSIVAALAKGAEKVLIVCPASLKLNWEREINYFCDDTTIISNKKWKDTGRFTIINYDILKNFHSTKQNYNVKKKDFKKKEEHTELIDAKFDLVIIDEAHKLKNDKSQRGKVMTELSKIIPTVWLLTGTPITSKPIDYFNLLNLINSNVSKNWNTYVKRYCDGKQITKYTRWGKKDIWVTDGASNLHELHLQTKNNILRRLKSEVLDMPEKTVTTIPYVLTSKEQKGYDEIWDEYLESREKLGKSINIERDMVELGLMRKYIAMATIPKTIEMAESAIEQGNKVIIFTTFTEELDTIHKHFGKLSVKHNGKMTEKNKQKSVDSFQGDDGIKVFVGNVVSAGVGITLTKANIVIFNSFSWVPGDNEQCEDRAYRIGQKNNVSIYYQLFKDTVTTLMWGVLKNKSEVIKTILNGQRHKKDGISIPSSFDRRLTTYERDELINGSGDNEDDSEEYVELY